MNNQFPQYVLDLIDLYGPPTQKVWHSAVFYEKVEPDTDLDSLALRYCQYISRCSDAEFPNSPWFQSWQRIYQRPTHRPPNFFRDLREALIAGGLDYEDRIASDLEIYLYDKSLMNDLYREDNAAKQGILAAAFDASEVDDFRVYTIGDGEVLEGLLIVAGRSKGEVVILATMSD